MPRRVFVLVVVAGLAAAVFLYLQLRKEKWRSLEPSEIDRPEQLDDLHVDLGEVDPEPWVRTYVPNKASPGFNLGLYRRRIPIVFDMTGRIVHAWPEVRAIGRVRLSREGRLAAIGTDNLVKEYDWEGDLTWYHQLPDNHHFPHHDLITLENGNYLILGYDGHTRTDYLHEVDRDGRIVWEWWMHEHRRSFSGWDAKSTDPSHSNSIRELPANRWFDAGDARFRPGNILVSARNLNTIFVIDKVTGEVVWQYSRGLDHQHEALMIEEGRSDAGLIMVFNNGLEDLYAYRRSLVQSIDPVAQEVVWEYGSEHFFSTVGGTAQPLPGKNILITSSNGGRVFEIRPRGRIVWEWAPPFKPMRVQRLPADHCPQLAAMAPPDAGACRRLARRPFVDKALFSFDFPFDTEERVVDGKKRRLLKSNQGCRQLLIPSRASVSVNFGIDGGRLRGRSVRARFTMTIAGDDEPQLIVDETIYSGAKDLWVQRRVPLSDRAYEHVEMCIATEVVGEGWNLLELAVWANPAVRSKSQRPARLPARGRITEQERRLREQHLKALGYVN